MFLYTIYGTLMNNDEEARSFELISDSLELSVMLGRFEHCGPGSGSICIRNCVLSGCCEAHLHLCV